ncbi:MAG: hypothetical protein LBJ07_03780 [Actinomycetes bacterium]|nr:hypothetical protein [Actinomycetes bacterium]
MSTPIPEIVVVKSGRQSSLTAQRRPCKVVARWEGQQYARASGRIAVRPIAGGIIWFG